MQLKVILLAVLVLFALARAEFDCAGIENGDTQVDRCGVCGGTNDCVDSNNIACSAAEKDCAGICNGTSMEDCAGTCNGDAALDCAGTCNGDATSDCAGTCNGEAKLDKCGVCNGNSSCLDPDGTPCEEAEKDCFGFCFGLARFDSCGDCNGHDERKDIAGVCCDTHLKDCNNVCNGTSVVDKCGVCNGNNTGLGPDGQCCTDEKKGCDGVCYSKTTLDSCGVCGGDSSSCCGPKGACNNHGACNAESRECRCSPGWTGHLCQSQSDVCIGVDCGKNGECQPDGIVGTCHCADGWMGSKCQFLDCNAHGAYNPDTEKCHCLPPYAGNDCLSCSEPSSEHVTRVCVMNGENTRAMEVPTSIAEHIVEKGSAEFFGKEVVVFMPETVFNKTTYDCACHAVRISNARFTPEAAEFALNQILIDMVNITETSNEELFEAVSRAQDHADMREFYPLFVLWLGSFLFAGVMVATLAGVGAIIRYARKTSYEVL